MRRVIPILTLLLAATLAFASNMGPHVRGEIEALLDRLERSGCQFNRNGTWHSSAEARTHLMRKLDYVEHRAPGGSTEDFITLAASESSRSGKPYLVKCGDTAPVESRTWLTQQLMAIRQSGTAGDRPRQ